MQVIGFDVVLARDVETNDLIRLPINDLYPVSAPSTVAHSIAKLAELEDRDGNANTLPDGSLKLMLPANVLTMWTRDGGKRLLKMIAETHDRGIMTRCEKLRKTPGRGHALRSVVV
jgi:hypothetical protein